MYFNVAIRFMDSRLRETTRSVGYDSTFPDAVTFAEALASAYADVSDARVVGYTISMSGIVHDAEGDTASNIDEGATIRVKLESSPPRNAVIRIPAPEQSIIGSVGEVLLDEPDIVALETLLKGDSVRVAYCPIVEFVSGWLDK